MLKLLFTAADIGVEGIGSCDAGSCDLRGDGRLGREELRKLFLVLIKESGSLSWLHLKYRADPRFKHMLSDYCKSPLKWTADAALHEFLTFDTPPAVAAAPLLFTDTTRMTWDGLNKIMEVKRQAGSECTIEVLTRNWIDAAITQLSTAVPVAPDSDEYGWHGGEVGEAADGAEDGDFEEIAGDDDAPAPALLASSLPLNLQPRACAAGGSCYVGPGFPLPVGVAAAAQATGPTLRVDSAAAQRFVR